MLSHSLRRFVGTELASLAIATAACGGGDGGDTTGPSDPGVPADVSGTYALTGLKTLGTLHGGGSGMPVTFTDGGGSTLTRASASRRVPTRPGFGYDRVALLRSAWTSATNR